MRIFLVYFSVVSPASNDASTSSSSSISSAPPLRSGVGSFGGRGRFTLGLGVDDCRSVKAVKIRVSYALETLNLNVIPSLVVESISGGSEGLLAFCASADGKLVVVRMKWGIRVCRACCSLHL